jgi:hypothetical protein
VIAGAVISSSVWNSRYSGRVVAVVAVVVDDDVVGAAVELDVAMEALPPLCELQP